MCLADPKIIVFKLLADIERVLLQSSDAGGAKQLLPLCDVMYHALVEKHVPDVGVQFHTLSPMKRLAEAAPKLQPNLEHLFCSVRFEASW